MNQVNKYSRVLDKYYRVLFKLPSDKIVLVTILIVFLILYLFVGTMSSIYLLYFIILVAIITIYSRLFRRSIFYKVKRVVVLSLVSIIYAIVVSFFTNWVVGIVSSIVILIIVIQSLDGNSTYRYIVCVVPLYIMLAIMYLNNKISVKEIVFSITSSFILVLIDYTIYVALSRYRINGFKSVDLGTLYIWNWLERRKDIENVFEKLSSINIVKPFLLMNNSSVLLYTDIHYGPFSNIGSSELPRVISHFFRSRGYYSIILHGTGSHERDIPHSRYIDIFIKECEKTLYEKGIVQKYYGLFRLMSSEWVLTSIVFTDISLILVSRPGGGIDDLPYDLQRLIDEESRVRNTGRVVVVDTHNWELESEPNINCLEKMLIESLDYINLLKSTEPVDVLTRSACINEKIPGVIDGETCLYELKGIDNRGYLVLVYFRGNNVDPGLRNKIIKYVKERFSEAVVEVLTNDEHSETGIYTGASYVPVRDCDEIYRALDKLMNMLQQRDYTRGLYLSQFSTNYPLLNNNVYKLVDLLEKIYPVAVSTLLSYIFMAPLLIYVLYNFMIY